MNDVQADMERGVQPLDDVRLGQWVRRVRADGTPQTKFHKVESVVNGNPIVHCGRTLRAKLGGTGLAFAPAVTGPDRCERCIVSRR